MARLPFFFSKQTIQKPSTSWRAVHHQKSRPSAAILVTSQGRYFWLTRPWSHQNELSVVTESQTCTYRLTSQVWWLCPKIRLNWPCFPTGYAYCTVHVHGFTTPTSFTAQYRVNASGQLTQWKLSWWFCALVWCPPCPCLLRARLQPYHIGWMLWISTVARFAEVFPALTVFKHTIGFLGEQSGICVVQTPSLAFWTFPFKAL